jgi:pimeloyl-ACP methyl ester carboxylesterase
MSAEPSKTSYQETPVYFDAGRDTLFGLLTMPRSGGARTGFIILTGAGTPLTLNRNRLSVRLCRELAGLGYAGLRFDYHGAGESTGAVEQFRLDRPFVRDVTAAVRCLQAHGVERVILAGSCFGARNALCTAAELDNVDAVVLIAAALRDYAMGEHKILGKARQWSLPRYAREGLRPSRLRGLWHARTRRQYFRFVRGKLRVMGAKVPWLRRFQAAKPTATEDVSETFERALRRLVERGAVVRFVYGEADTFYRDEFLPAAAGRLSDVLGRQSDSIEVAVLPGRLHGFTSVEAQDVVVEDIVDWMTRRRSTAESAGTHDAAKLGA